MNLQDRVNKFLIFQEAKGNSHRTIATYEQRLRWFLEEVNTEGGITSDDADVWIVSLRRRGLSPHTVNSRLRDVKAFYRWQLNRGMIDHSPFAHLTVKQRQEQETKAMTQIDLRKMLAVSLTLRDQAMIKIFASTGCRAGEVANLKFKDLDLIKREAKITGKTGSRYVDFNRETTRTLREWITEHPNYGCGFVFVGVFAPHNPITPGSIYSAFRRLAIRARVKGSFNPHAVRHLVGQTWADNVNLELVRKKLGHRDLTSTLRYANQDRTRVKMHTDIIHII
ncbi:MAG: tyrosine-type recombinase/integrase [Chloroflexi bacterium]|nr:tyrosine-type recombinase/integrase [Chloroflexota bacterium]